MPVAENISSHAHSLDGDLKKSDGAPMEKHTSIANATGISDEVSHNSDGIQRNLSGRQIQMIAIEGSIGTALFVSIGSDLISGGPAAWLRWLSSCPFPASFIRFAHAWVDPAFGFMAGWNIFAFEALMVPFEITALSLILTYWRDDIPVAAVCAACIVCYTALNIFAVKYYGESEFWLGGGKVLLVFIVFSFAFVTMVGGNPQHDAYGFRYWNTPGAFAELYSTGALGRFQGFLGSLWSAAFTIVGPEFLAMAAGETKNPRTSLKKAFKTVYWRFGALVVGIIIPYNDPTLISNSGSGTAAVSPYVVAMHNMGITVLPDIVTALLFSTIFSASDVCAYCTIQCLHGMALNGQAPKVFKRITKAGVPWTCVCFVMCFGLLSFLSVSNGADQALTWLTNLSEAAEILDFITMGIIYIFYRACKAQGIGRRILLYQGWWQPWISIIGVIGTGGIVLWYGYGSMRVGHFDIAGFLHNAMVFVAIITFSGYKLFMKTSFVKPEEAGLVWDRPIIDAYEACYVEKEASSFLKSTLTHLGIDKAEKADTTESK